MSVFRFNDTFVLFSLMLRILSATERRKKDTDSNPGIGNVPGKFLFIIDIIAKCNQSICSQNWFIGLLVFSGFLHN